MRTINTKKMLSVVTVSLLTLSCNQAIAAQQAPKLKSLKAELAQLKQQYDSKIKQLEDRLAKAEQTAKDAKQTAQGNQNDIEDTQDNVDQLSIDVSQQSNQTAANTFNPAIGMVLNGRYVSYSNNFDYQLPGYFPAKEIGVGDHGLQIGESELNLNTNIDDKFFGNVTISFGNGASNVEEAFIQTINLGQGFNIKAGKFLSSIGYLAGKHQHTDDFANRPLPYQAFFGGKYGDAGVQVTWLAPTNLYWESGTELYRGDSFPAGGAAQSGKGVWTAFTHIGGDIGNSQTWRAGLSYLNADVVKRQSIGADMFTGSSKLWIADFLYKWSPNGNRGFQEFKLQGEYLSRKEQGVFSNATLTNANIDMNQNGWYVEGVYRFAQQWSAGIRTSRLSADNLPTLFNGSILDSLHHSPTENSMMVNWSNSEFSHVRLQYDISNLQGQSNNVLTLQYIAAFGAHGAHAF